VLYMPKSEIFLYKSGDGSKGAWGCGGGGG
jgi:hypothetical protein